MILGKGLPILIVALILLTATGGSANAQTVQPTAVAPVITAANVAKLVPVAVFQGFSIVVQHVDFAQDGARLYAVGDLTFRVWDVNSTKEIGNMARTSTVHAFALSPDNKWFAMINNDNNKTLDVWDLPGNRRVTQIANVPNTGAALAFSPDSKLLAYADSTGRLHIHEIESAKDRTTFVGNGDPVIDAAFSPDGNKLAVATCGRPHGTCEEKSEVRLWDVASGTQTGTVTTTTQVTRVAFSPDGKILALAGCGSIDTSTLVPSCRRGEIRLWDLAANKSRFTLTAAQEAVDNLTFSPDGALITTGACADPVAFSCPRGAIWVWETKTGRLLKLIKEHTNRVLSLAFSPDGTMLVSGAADASALLWKVGEKPLERQGVVFSVDVSGPGYEYLKPLADQYPTQGYPRFKVDVKVARYLIQTCPYSNGSQRLGIWRYGFTATVGIYDAATNAQLASQTFQGKSPDACPAHYAFSHGSEEWVGNKPDNQAILKWLGDALKRLSTRK